MTAVLTPEEVKEFEAGYNDKSFTPAAEQTDAEKAEAEKIATEKAAAGEQTDAEKADAEKADAEKADAEKAAAEKAAAEKAAAGEQTDAEKAEAEKAAAAEQTYQPDYAKLFKDTADEIKRDTHEAISRITTKKPEIVEPAKPDLTKTAAEIGKALEGLSNDQVKQTLQKVRDTDPETADALEGLFGKVTGTVGSLAKAVETLRVNHESDQAKAKEVAQATAVSQVETTIAAKHPTFREIVGSFDGKVKPSDEFTKWFNDQPAYLQETARATDDPNVFVSILDKFVSDTLPAQTDAEKAEAEKIATEKAAAGEQTDAEKAIEEARRAGARQPVTKTHIERKATGTKALSEDDEWMKGYNDPEFDKKK